MLFTAEEIAAVTGGRRHGPDVTVSSVGFDSRDSSAGSLFVPLVAERDGHDFIPAAVESGAVAYLGQRGPDARVGDRATCIEVPDTGSALVEIGRSARLRLAGNGFDERVVAVTGSVGKSSVKDMAASVLGTRWATLSTPGNFNNEIGLPVALANSSPDNEAAVLEMGARGVGHIALLCDIGRPAVGIVTVVASVHTEVFGSIDDVARGKGELIESLPASGAAVLNANDHRVMGMRSRTSARCVTFDGAPSPDGGGTGSTTGAGPSAGRADVVAEAVELDGELRPRFRLVSPWGTAAVRLGAHGAHSVHNALAAAAAGLVLGVSVEEVADGLARADLSHWRMELLTAVSGARILNDAYNASPMSVTAALEGLEKLESRRRLAVLGVMAELGPEGPAEHARMGALARSLGIEVVAVDTDAYGFEPVAGIDGARAALDTLDPPLGPGDVVLVKGSRVAGLERLAAALVKG